MEGVSHCTTPSPMGRVGRCTTLSNPMTHGGVHCCKTLYNPITHGEGGSLYNVVQPHESWRPYIIVQPHDPWGFVTIAAPMTHGEKVAEGAHSQQFIMVHDGLQQFVWNVETNDTCHLSGFQFFFYSLLCWHFLDRHKQSQRD